MKRSCPEEQRRENIDGRTPTGEPRWRNINRGTSLEEHQQRNLGGGTSVTSRSRRGCRIGEVGVCSVDCVLVVGRDGNVDGAGRTHEFVGDGRVGVTL